MGRYTTESIRNLVLLGHGASGKTTLAEAMLFKAGVTSRKGSAEAGNSILDADEEERERKFSIRSAVACFQWKDWRINLVDAPGYPDFVGEACCAVTAVESAVIVVDAASGIGVNTRKMYRLAEEKGLARFIVLSKMDAEGVDFEGLLGVIEEQLGKACKALMLPVGQGSDFRGVVDLLAPPDEAPEGLVGDLEARREDLVEAVVETDDELMERYLEGEEIDREVLSRALAKAVVSGKMVPVLCCSGRTDVGVEEVLEALAHLAPSPVEGVQRQGRPVGQSEGEPVPIEPDPDKPFLAQVFKVVTDPFVGKLCYMRVHRGRFAGEGASVTNARTGKSLRVAQLLETVGKEQKPFEGSAIPGDIVAAAKLDDLRIGDTVFTGGEALELPRINVPEPMVSLAVEPKSRGDEQKISGALGRIAEEDLTFRVGRDQQTRELVITGVTTLHLDVILSRLKRQFGVEVTTKPPKIAYRETITKSVKYVEYTHKKQTGGAGQYARVVIDLEPLERGAGYEFVDEIVGGVIDQQFRPSVDKGIQKKMAEGVLAGYPVTDVRVRLVDGKTHPVDSKDIAFQIAGREAFKKAFMQCNPVLLEPIVNVEITVPSRAVGDVTGDLNSRRGRIMGIDQLGSEQVIRAQVPLAEMLTYSTQLRSITGGEGSFTMEFSHYDIVPPNIQQQIVAAAQREREQKES